MEKRLRCDMCGTTENVQKIRVPSDVIVDKNSNIVDVTLGDYLPLCSDCFSILNINITDKKGWIEKILKTKYYDGRWRIVDLILMPYLANVRGFDKGDSVDIIFNWLKRCGVYNKEYSSKEYLKKQFEHVKGKELEPLTKANFYERGFDKYAKT